MGPWEEAGASHALALAGPAVPCLVVQVAVFPFVLRELNSRLRPLIRNSDWVCVPSLLLGPCFRPHLPVPTELADSVVSPFLSINRYLSVLRLGVRPLQCPVCAGLSVG